MSLETTHGAFKGPYGKYRRWIKWLASQAGINLELMQGFRNDTGVAGRAKWEIYSHEDITILLNQPLGEGRIMPNDCIKIANRLTTILRQIPANDPWRETTLQFRDGLMNAYTLDEPLIYE